MQKSIIYLILSTIFISSAAFADIRQDIINHISDKCKGDNANKQVCIKLAPYKAKEPNDGVILSIIGELKKSFSSIPVCASNVDLTGTINNAHTTYIKLCVKQALQDN